MNGELEGANVNLPFLDVHRGVILGDDAHNPTYIFIEPRVAYRMPKGETQGREAVTRKRG